MTTTNELKIREYLELLPTFEYNPEAESLVNALYLSNSKGNKDFYRFVVNSVLTYAVSALFTKVRVPSKEPLIVNFYGFALGTSGIGKSSTVTILQNRILDEFNHKIKILEGRHANTTIKEVAKKYIEVTANNPSPKAKPASNNFSDTILKLVNDYNDIGPHPLFVKSATEAALRNLVYRSRLSGVNAINIFIDEIGSSMNELQSVNSSMLELYDTGDMHATVRKGDSNKSRPIPISTSVPVNLVAYGTPNLILNRSREEEDFTNLLIQGYARRCFFCIAMSDASAILNKSVEEIMQEQHDDNIDSTYETTKQMLLNLVNEKNIGVEYGLTEETHYEYILYSLAVEYEAYQKNLEAIHPALDLEQRHKASKALKLATVYASIKNRGDYLVHLDDFREAIRFTEDSQKFLTQMLNSESEYERIAKFIINSCTDTKKYVRELELAKKFKFYEKATNAKKKELIELSLSQAYDYNAIIKKEVNKRRETIFTCDKISSTNLSSLFVSYNMKGDYSKDYLSGTTTFERLTELVKSPSTFWCNHMFTQEKDTSGKSINGTGHREEHNVIDGFNLLVLDIDNKKVDSPLTLEQAKQILANYTYLIYTTKSHNPEGIHRFRIILPIAQVLKLNKQDYHDFYNNVLEYLPFECDKATSDRARLWYSNPQAEVFTNKGELLNALPFIPNTIMNQNNEGCFASGSRERLDEWFLNEAQEGNRNHTILRYALSLVDSGLSCDEVKESVLDFNNKLTIPLPEEEIESTIFVTLTKKYNK